MAKDENASPRVNRISLPLNEDGTAVDWHHVRTATAEKFESLLRTDPQIRRAYEEENGIAKDADGADPFGGVTQENVHALLDTIGKANSMLFQIVAGKWMKHPFLKDAKTGKPAPWLLEPDIVQRLQFSEAQHAELDPRATKIAQKYSGKLPKWLRENMDLYMFGYMFVAYTAENAKTVLTLQMNRDLARMQDAYAKQQAQSAKPVDSDVPKNGADKMPPPEFTQPSGEDQIPLV